MFYITGTGKSETAIRIAETLLRKRIRHIATDMRSSTPRGLLVLRGEHFSSASEAGNYIIHIMFCIRNRAHMIFRKEGFYRGTETNNGTSV
jgi:hypothetical protein